MTVDKKDASAPGKRRSARVRRCNRCFALYAANLIACHACGAAYVRSLILTTCVIPSTLPDDSCPTGPETHRFDAENRVDALASEASDPTSAPDPARRPASSVAGVPLPPPAVRRAVAGSSRYPRRAPR